MDEERELLQLLSRKARRLGARDPEETAQEALRRSLENWHSRAAITYYFSPRGEAISSPPEWSSAQLIAWLCGVVQMLVLEERTRRSASRPSDRADSTADAADPAPSQLEVLIRSEQRRLALNSLASLGDRYRRVLEMRAHGMKYGEIAGLLGVSENTVATWVSRGVRRLNDTLRTQRVTAPKTFVDF
jgi:RNA polymerase sigma factor (sigma-70 family)